MALKVTIWLTEEEGAALQDRAEQLEMTYWQLATLIVGKAVGAQVKATPRARQKWLKNHEAKTRAEFKGGTSLTKVKLLRTFEKAGPGAVLSTKQLLDGIGWKKTGSLLDRLREDPDFKETVAPPGAVRNRGRQPKYWKYLGDGSSSL